MVPPRRPGHGDAEETEQDAPYRTGRDAICAGAGARTRGAAGAPAWGPYRAARGGGAWLAATAISAGAHRVARGGGVARRVLTPRRAGGAGARPAGGGQLLPGALRRLRLGRRDLRRGAGDPLPLRPAQHLVLTRRHQERRPLLAARLHQLLAGAQAVGPAAGRLSRRQHPAASAQLPAAVAPAGTLGGARRGGDRGAVRGASAARRVGGLDHRAQGRAVGVVLPGRGAGLDPLHGGAAAGTLRAGAGAVHGRVAEQVGGGDAAGGAADLALVAARPGDAQRAAAGGAVGGGSGGDYRGGPVVLHRAGAAGAGLHGAGAGADRGARAVVLRRQAAVAGGAGGDLPAVGDRRRRRAGLGIPGWRGGAGGAAVAGAAAAGAGAAGGSAVLRGDAGAGAGVRGLRLHAVLRSWRTGSSIWRGSGCWRC